MKIIQKVYEPKIGRKISWHQTTPYKLGDEGNSFPFNVQIMDKKNTILENRLVNIPANVMQVWSSDETITNYLISQLGLQLDTDNSIEFAIAKLNSGTINYASGGQVANDNVLKNYVSSINTQLQQHKDGSIEIDEFSNLDGYSVNVTVNSQNFTLKNFIKSLVSLSNSDKTTKLDTCITALEIEP